MPVVYAKPAQQPVTPDEVREHLNMPLTDYLVHADKLERLTDAARVRAENYAAITTSKRTGTLYLDEFSNYAGGVIELPNPPALSVQSIKYYDSDDALQTLSSSVYQVDVRSTPARILPAANTLWPGTYDRVNAVEIAFTAGHSKIEDIPQPIKLAILMMVATAFSNAEDIIVGTNASPMPTTAEHLLMPFKMNLF